MQRPPITLITTRTRTPRRGRAARRLIHTLIAILIAAVLGGTLSGCGGSTPPAGVAGDAQPAAAATSETMDTTDPVETTSPSSSDSGEPQTVSGTLVDSSNGSPSPTGTDWWDESTPSTGSPSPSVSPTPTTDITPSTTAATEPGIVPSTTFKNVSGRVPAPLVTWLQGGQFGIQQIPLANSYADKLAALGTTPAQQSALGTVASYLKAGTQGMFLELDTYNPSPTAIKRTVPRGTYKHMPVEGWGWKDVLNVTTPADVLVVIYWDDASGTYRPLVGFARNGDTLVQPVG